MNKLTNLVTPNTTLKSALKILDKASTKLLVVVNTHNKLLGTLSDGDIRRLLINGHSLTEKIDTNYQKSSIYIKQSEFSKKTATEVCQNNSILGLPIVSDDLSVINFFSTYNSIATPSDHSKIPHPVVIMGGGKGTRMQPISDIFPKPLIPIQGKPMIEYIIDYFRRYHVNDFHITLNYKSELMIAYFQSTQRDYNISFITESQFMGTAGSILLLKDRLPETFIVSNCDCLTKANFNEAVTQHHETQSKLTIITSIQHHQIPYGTIHYQPGGSVTKIEEKPELSFPVNTGVYIANHSILNYITPNTMFHMTDLAETLIQNNKKVSCYFINEKEFIDFGQWKEYKKTLNLFTTA